MGAQEASSVPGCVTLWPMILAPAAVVLLAAALFGASTPLAKLLVGAMPPLLLAGLLYLGSGLGLGLLLLARAWLPVRSSAQPLRAIPRRDIPWLAGAVVAGGMLGPALLTAGLARSPAATAALLLNLEAVLTASIAWLVFKENADRRIVTGMAAIVAGGVLLAWEPGAATPSTGALLIAAACACWAIDNNLTRQVSAHDAMLIAGVKGLVAGSCNTALALAGGAAWPAAATVAAALAVGFLGYGVSLALFVVGLRTLGTARTGAYFSLAPLFGVVLSLALWPAWPGAMFWFALVLMAAGTAVHLFERHEHPHVHEPMTHAHAHVHDEHHRHVHDFAWDGREPHSHPHAHGVLRHVHPHVPDIHHRHVH